MIPQPCSCLLHIIRILERNNCVPIVSELPVWNEDARICTAIDLLCMDAVGGDWRLVELKTSTSLTQVPDRDLHFSQVLLTRELLLRATQYRSVLPTTIKCSLLEVHPRRIALLQRRRRRGAPLLQKPCVVRSQFSKRAFKHCYGVRKRSQQQQRRPTSRWK